LVYISNYRKEIVVQLSDVAQVIESSPTGNISSYNVLIRFHPTTALGPKVVVAPARSGLAAADRIVDEISAAAARASRGKRV